MQIHKNIVFQWNSTGDSIEEVRWGVKAQGNSFKLRLIYTDNIRPNSTRIDVAVENSPYKGRVSFVGDLSTGRAWFKLANVTLGDTKDYSIKIREDAVVLFFLKTELIVTGKNFELFYILCFSRIGVHF